MACGGGGRGGTGWSSLPADLLLAVFALLPSDADRSRFRAVCAAWAAAAAAWRPGPWLVGSRTDRAGRGGGAVSSFWLSPTPGAGLLPFAANVPAGLEYLSSSRGYLALSDPTASPKAIVLVNPVTGRRVRLPPIAFFKRVGGGGGRVPDDLPRYYSSTTGAWARLDFRAQGYAGVEHYNGRFYVAFRSQICVCEVVGGDATAVIPLERADGADDGDGSDDEKLLPPCGRRVVETHLVDCGGQLLLVSVHDDVVYNSDDDMAGLAVDDEGISYAGDARAVEVHRVEWLGDGAVRLVRVADLGWNALFLGRNRAFALSPAEFPACRANCIYLVDRQGHPDGVVRVVDMESQWARREETICPDDGPRGSSSAGWARRGWFFPNY
ncbi:hypothetical protein SETIT_9G189900v2 [Setaria italica]|uniref:Uncharacterized protein n=1 Tax=Setaria italica TaxID=4555 RepID=A0A368SI57_SETIT|nr:hypothetical protein SETIT_9G189900v2 [Setaria italica]